MSALLHTATMPKLLHTATTKDYKGNASATLFFLVVRYTHPIGLERTVYQALARGEGC